MAELSLYAKNFVHQTLAVGYTAGSGTISVPNGAAWGDPSPALAIILTAFKASDLNTPVFNAKITGRSGNALTIAAITWGADQNLDVGDVVVNTPAAEYIDDIDAALASKSAVGHTHDDRYYTESEIDAALAAKSGVGHLHDDRYYTESEADALLSIKSSVGHTHDERYYTEGEVDAALSGKSDVGHTHAISDVTGLQSSLDDKSAVGHIHDDRYYTEGEVDAALAGKASTSHTHAASDITSGTVATARLGSGTANATSFLRGDQTWATPSGGSVTSPKSADFSVQTTENGYVYPVTAGVTGVVCTLPTPASAGDGFSVTIYKDDASKGNVTFAGTGAPSVTLYLQQESITVRSDGTSWRVIARHRVVTDTPFGGGTDGDVTISGSVTLTRDMFYNNLTLAAGAALNTAAYRVHVKSCFDISNAPAGAINTTSTAGGNATGANQATGGIGGQTVSRTLGGQLHVGQTGASGGTGAGTQPGQVSANSLIGTATSTGTAGQGGAGGSGSGGAGGTARPSTTASALYTLPQASGLLLVGAASSFLPVHLGSNGGQSGSSGGGDGTNNGGGGGGHGRGPQTVAIFARKILRGASTAANAIQVNGSNGGNGGSPSTGNCGGGGGGAGGSGGLVFLCYGELIGSTATNCIQARGGNGGNGGNGVGTGTAGTGAYSGCAGRVALGNLATDAWMVSTGSDVVANSAQTGGTAAEFQVSL
jgi:hypothetical protein